MNIIQLLDSAARGLTANEVAMAKRCLNIWRGSPSERQWACRADGYDWEWVFWRDEEQLARIL